MTDEQARLEAIRLKQENGLEVTHDEVIEAQTIKIRELKSQLREETARAERAEAALNETRGRLEADAAIRPSIEVLQRMANGLDPFDRGRFQCAVAALPHETPKLSASIASTGTFEGIGHRLDSARRRREALEQRGLRIIDGDPTPAA